MQHNQQYIQDDEIDLRELFKTLWESKVFIAIFTLVITLISVLYVIFKNPTPIYKGTLLVEIGEIKTQDSIVSIDNPHNLKYILEAEAEAETETETEKEEKEAEVIIPKRTDRLIQINVPDISKEKIKQRVNFLYKKLIERQNEKLKIYKEYNPTKKIGDIIFDKEPVNAVKKKLIVSVALVTGFVMSVFLVFFIGFIKNFREEQR